MYCATWDVSGTVLSATLLDTELSLLALFGLFAVIGWQHDSSGARTPEGFVRNRACAVENQL